MASESQVSPPSKRCSPAPFVRPRAARGQSPGLRSRGSEACRTVSSPSRIQLQGPCTGSSRPAQARRRRYTVGTLHLFAGIAMRMRGLELPRGFPAGGGVRTDVAGSVFSPSNSASRWRCAACLREPISGRLGTERALVGRMTRRRSTCTCASMKRSARSRIACGTNPSGEGFSRCRRSNSTTSTLRSTS
jgi:hypothetical protein